MSPFLVRWIKLSLVVVVGCGFLAMAIYAFVMRDEIRNAQIEPPLVTAPDGPLKSRPEQPGGMEIPNRDKLVFDLLDSNATVSGDFPMPSSTNAQPPMVDTASGQIVDVESDVSTTANVQPVPQVQAAAAMPVQPMPQPVSQPQAVAPVKEVAVASPAQPVAVKVEAKPLVAKVEPKPTVVEPKASGAGSWGVQLAAVSSKSDGDSAAAKLAKQYPALKGLSSRVVAAPDGKHFRVQFTGLKDRAAASAVCSKLGKQACLPVAPK